MRCADNAALLNRFTGHGQVIKIEPMKVKQEREILLARMPALSTKLARRVCDLANRLRRGDGQTPGLIPTLSTREVINYCQKLMLYRDPIKAAHVTFLGVVQDENVRQPAEQAIALILGRRVFLGRAPGTPGEKSAAKVKGKTPKAPAGAPKGVGRVASQVTDPTETKAIWEAYKGNGGALSYEQIEKDPRFNLRHANGNTAYRIVKKHERLNARRARLR
jgi:hypothetical protein